MGVSEAFDRLKKTVMGNPDKAEGAVDKAADAAKKATGGSYDDKIDKGADKATEYLRNQSDEDGQNSEGDGRNREK